MVEAFERTNPQETSHNDRVRIGLLDRSYHDPAEDASNRCCECGEGGMMVSNACVCEKHDVDDEHNDPVYKHPRADKV